VTAPFTTDACRSCGKPVIWCVTIRANAMPVDAEPATDGNIAVEYRGADVKPLARVLSTSQQFGRTSLHKSHFATCPHGAEWRRRKARTP
jgi:hypothetical protein